ncbi:MAG: hypothetical protein ABR903_02340 [Thermodesulfovibrionales bacterium]|jgi:hypothetical protein
MTASIVLVAAWLVVMRLARRSAWQIALISLPGTALHELSHFLIGTLLLAKPVSVSLIPKRKGNGWQLGAVEFTGLNIINAAPVTYAPLLLVGLAWLLFDRWMMPVFKAGGYSVWVLSGYAVACALFSCLPSTTDIKASGLSPFAWGAVCYGVWWLCH